MFKKQFILIFSSLVIFASCNPNRNIDGCIDPTFEFNTYQSVDPACKTIIYNPLLNEDSGPFDELEESKFETNYIGQSYVWIAENSGHKCVPMDVFASELEDHYEFEVSFTFVGNNQSPSGIYFNSPDDCETSYRLVFNDTKAEVYSTSEQGEIELASINRTFSFEPDLLTIRKVGNTYYFFANRDLVYKTSALPDLGHQFGLRIGSISSAYVKSVTYSKLI